MLSIVAGLWHQAMRYSKHGSTDNSQAMVVAVERTAGMFRAGDLSSSVDSVQTLANLKGPACKPTDWHHGRSSDRVSPECSTGSGRRNSAGILANLNVRPCSGHTAAPVIQGPLNNMSYNVKTHHNFALPLLASAGQRPSSPCGTWTADSIPAQPVHEWSQRPLKMT
jgi:hypothetical protein